MGRDCGKEGDRDTKARLHAVPVFMLSLAEDTYVGMCRPYLSSW